MRKAAAGAKGSIFEESYLLGSLARLIQDGGKLPALVGELWLFGLLASFTLTDLLCTQT